VGLERCHRAGGRSVSSGEPAGREAPHISGEGGDAVGRARGRALVSVGPAVALMNSKLQASQGGGEGLGALGAIDRARPWALAVGGQPGDGPGERHGNRPSP
jgi:hypothetical protein